MATNQGGPKQQQITKNNRFEKQQILHFKKQQQMKRTSNFKKQQISKNIKFQKNNKLKKPDIKKQQILKNRHEKVGNSFGIHCLYCNMFLFCF